MYGWTMPELRSGARRSKRLGDLQQPTPELNDQGENFLPPTQNKTRRRGGGRGRGANAAAGLGKGAQAGVGARQAGRGRGVRVIDLDPEVPGEAVPQVAPIGVAGGAAQNRVEGAADKDIAMEGGSADKLVAAEEDANSTPVPDRVYSILSCNTFPCVCFYVAYHM